MNCIALNRFGMEHKEAKVTLQKFKDNKVITSKIPKHNIKRLGDDYFKN